MNDAVPRRNLPNALSQFAALRGMMRERRPVVFTDYDGVLTPIVATPDLAVLDDRMRRAVEEVASTTTLAVISGRDLRDVRSKVGVDGIYYAGSHGFDIVGPDGRPTGEDLIDGFSAYLAPLNDATDRIAGRLSRIEGVLIERKRFATAVHYRNVDRARIDEIEQAVRDVAAGHPTLTVTSGKEIFEYRPDFDWDKGRVLEWLLSELADEVGEATPAYLGDDTTDEDAFRALRDRGVGVVVGLDGPATLARFSLHDCDEVREFLLRLARWDAWRDE